jgi:hypothetical protein
LSLFAVVRLVHRHRRFALGLSALAAQLGAVMPTTDPGSSPAFYVNLLKSRDLLRKAALTRCAFVLGTDSVRGTLVDLCRIRGDNPPIHRDTAVKRLVKDLEITTVRETGVVNLEVTTPWAGSAISPFRTPPTRSVPAAKATAKIRALHGGLARGRTG